jgi:hypothetical protein
MIFAAALVWLGGGGFAAAAPPSPDVDLRVLCERYYQQAKWASPAADAAEWAHITLLLPGEPLLTAADAAPRVAPTLLDADYGWYADTARAANAKAGLTLTDEELAALSAADAEAAAALARAAADAAETPVGYDYEYGYEYGYSYEYDYDYDDDYQVSNEDAAPGPPEPSGELVAEETADETHYELYYGYDALGRPLKNWRANEETALTVEDYTRGYSPYDDRHADDYAAWAGLTSRISELRVGRPPEPPSLSPADKLVAAAESLATFDYAARAVEAADAAWNNAAVQAVATRVAAVRERIGTALIAAAAAQYDPYNYAEYGRGEYGFGELEYRSYEYYHADADDYFGHRVLKAELAASEPALDWRAIEQLAGALDRAGARLQQWSQALGDMACRRFAAAEAAKRR